MIMLEGTTRYGRCPDSDVPLRVKIVKSLAVSGLENAGPP